MRQACSVAIIGAGIAGAATGYALTRHGVRDIVILEKEPLAGIHSTGRNAAILRSLIPEPALRKIARESARFYRNPPEGFCPHALVDTVGIFLACRTEHSRELLASLGDGHEESSPYPVDPARLYERIPALAAGLATVLFQEDEGVLDVHAILQSFLQGACRTGAELRVGCEAVRLRITSGKVVGVETTGGLLEAEKVVLAGGGWAADLAAGAGFPLPLVPYRRHLLVTEPLPQVDRRWPVIWIVGDEFYFRPESGGLLMCACDAVPVQREQGELTDAQELEHIAVKAGRWLPGLATARVARAWAGTRTFAPDKHFVVGTDPRLQGLFWAAGLGGHGITCAPVVGEIAAQSIIHRTSAHPAAIALAPDRLLGT